MPSPLPKTFGSALILLALLLSASTARAQTFLPDPVEQTAVEVQWEKPFLGDGLSAFSSILEADAVIPLGPGRSLQVGIPFAVAGSEVVDGTSVYLGSLRASVLFGEPGSASGFLGITLPTASHIIGPDLAVVVGVLPWLDEAEKWMEDAVSLRGAVIPSWGSWGVGNRGRIGLRLGGSALTPTGLDSVWIFTRVAGWGRIPLERVELRADLATSYELSGDDGFGEQFTAYLDLGLGLLELSGHPGLFVRIPLDEDARGPLDLSIGLSARF